MLLSSVLSYQTREMYMYIRISSCITSKRILIHTTLILVGKECKEQHNIATNLLHLVFHNKTSRNVYVLIHV